MIRMLLMILATSALVLAMQPAASASECFLYSGPFGDPDFAVNLPFVPGAYGPCGTCGGVVQVDKAGLRGCLLPIASQ